MKLNTFAIALLLVLCEITAAHGQDLDATRLADLARQEYRNQRYDRSEKLFKDALDAIGRSGSTGPSDPDEFTRGAILRDLGTLYLDAERVADAEKIYTQALRIFRRSSFTAETALLLRHLGAVYSIQQRHKDAYKVLNKAFELAKKDPAVSTGLRVEILNSLGVAYFRSGNTGKAEKLFREGLALCEAQGALSGQFTTLLNNLGAVYTKKRDFPRAEALLIESLEQTETHFGHSHVALAYTLSTLGILYVDMKRYADAEQQHKRAIAILEQNGLDFDVRLARALKGLSDALIKGDKMAEAEAALERAILIARSSLTTHPDMAAILEAYSDLLGSVGKRQEAQQVYSEARRARLKMALTFRATGALAQ